MQALTEIERQKMQIDLAVVGFGPASAGFLYTLNAKLKDAMAKGEVIEGGAEGMPLQVVCYEKAENLSFGVSGVESSAKFLKRSLSAEALASIPLTTKIRKEKLLYLADPHGASMRNSFMQGADKFLNSANLAKNWSLELPFIPKFLQKHGGLITAIGQFNQWVAEQIMADGLLQIWPGMAVSDLLFEGDDITGVRLADQGLEADGTPGPAFMPGMDMQAALTVLGDGPMGNLGRKLNTKFGMPDDHHIKDWAVGSKFVVQLPDDTPLKEGTVIHTLGYPELEIFGFLYVLPGNMASMGIFLPSTFENPYKTSYRYLQQWMLHPAIHRLIKGAKLLSFGAKSLLESGVEAEPFVVQNGVVRIGESAGTTNILTNSGVDEAWESGKLLADAVFKMLHQKQPFSKTLLEKEYLSLRRSSEMEAEAKASQNARDGFRSGFFTGMLGMAMTGLSKGALAVCKNAKAPHRHIKSPENFFRGRISPSELRRLEAEATAENGWMFDKTMDFLGWPEIPIDGELFLSHQDALILGGKVQAAPGYADHIQFADPELCSSCRVKSCVEICSGQAITRVGEGTPAFDREKCLHCGACVWGCAQAGQADEEIQSNIHFTAAPGGLHSSEN